MGGNLGTGVGIFGGWAGEWWCKGMEGLGSDGTRDGGSESVCQQKREEAGDDGS